MKMSRVALQAPSLCFCRISRYLPESGTGARRTESSDRYVVPFPGQAFPSPRVHLRGAASLIRMVHPPPGDVHFVLGVALASGREQHRLSDPGGALQRHGIVT